MIVSKVDYDTICMVNKLMALMTAMEYVNCLVKRFISLVVSTDQTNSGS